MVVKQTSFGQLQVLLSEGHKPVVEHLIFKQNGRSHQHPEFESFFVLSGEGKIYSGDKTYDVKAGDLVSIPPKTKHWMEPENDQSMTGLLWYHQLPLKLKS